MNPQEEAELARRLGLPKIIDTWDWCRLKWQDFSTWLRWEEEDSRLFLVYDPPIDGLFGLYSYHASCYYHTGIRPPVENVVAGEPIHCCSWGMFLRAFPFSERLIAPRSGVFVNLIDPSRFYHATHKARLHKGEIPLCIELSGTAITVSAPYEIIEKLRKLKALALRGIGGEKTIAQRKLEALSKAYNIDWTTL